MKKLIITVMILAGLLLAGCSAQSAVEQTSAVVAEQTLEAPVRQDASIGNLLFGSLLLEKTEYPITAAQAEDLLPLWKLAKTLSTSDTAAQAEIQAVVTEITALMTSEQLDTIQNTQFTPESMQALFDELGITFGTGSADSGSSGEIPSGMGPGGGVGGGPGGGVPGQGMGMGAELTEEQQATMEARRAEMGGGLGFFNNPELYDALIESLESKIN